MSRAAIARLLRRPSPGWYLIGGVTAVNLLLAAVSFLKDLSFAAYFGTSRAADLVNTAFLLPEAIGYNLIAAVVGSAAVPELTRRWQESRYGAYIRATIRMAMHVTLLMLAAALLLALARDQLYALLGYRAGSPEAGQLERLYLPLLASLPLFPLYAVGGAALQAAGAFYAAAAGPVLLNGLMLAAIAASSLGGLAERDGALVYAFSILAGAGGMAALVWTALRGRLKAEAGLTLTAAWKLGHAGAADTASSASGGKAVQNTAPGRGVHAASQYAAAGTAAPEAAPVISSGLGRVYRDFLPLLLLTLFSQALYAAERMIASNQQPGTLAALNYAYRIAQFPNWVFVAAVTAVLLPSMSKAASAGSGRQSAKPELYRALRGTLLLMLPCAALLFALREPVISLLFGRGAFDGRSVALTSGLLAGYSLSAVGQAVSGICLRYFLACGRLYGPAAVYLISAACTIAFDLLAAGPHGPSALGYGSLCGWALNALLMFGLVVRDSDVRSG